MAEIGVTLRYATPDDGAAIARLAALDSAEPPRGPLLLAEVEGELRAALSLRDGSAIADPFHRTAALLELLRARASQLGAAGVSSRRFVPRREAWARRRRVAA
jgi:hypothetical protein